MQPRLQRFGGGRKSSQPHNGSVALCCERPKPGGKPGGALSELQGSQLLGCCCRRESGQKGFPAELLVPLGAGLCAALPAGPGSLWFRLASPYGDLALSLRLGSPALISGWQIKSSQLLAEPPPRCFPGSWKSFAVRLTCLPFVPPVGAWRAATEEWGTEDWNEDVGTLQPLPAHPCAASCCPVCAQREKLHRLLLCKLQAEPRGAVMNE